MKKDIEQKTVYQNRVMSGNIRPSWLFFGLILFGLLFISSRYNYLLFHVIVEFFTNTVAVMIFVITWNSRKFIDNYFFAVIGISFLFVGILGFAHTISYNGMNIIHGYDANLPTQLWIATRYLASLTTICAVFFISKKINFYHWFWVYTIITLIVLIAIFSKNFPDAYIVGIGLTKFKIYSEYINVLLLFIASLLLLKRKKYFQIVVLKMIIWSLTATIVAEMAFTLYVDTYGVLNLVGHFLELLAFILLYLSLVVTGVRNPQLMIFRNLKESENRLRQSEEKYRILAEVSPFTIKLLDMDFKIIYMNQMALKKYGFKKLSDVSGKFYLDIVLAENRDKINNALKKARNSNTCQIEYERNQDNGIKSVFQETFIPIIDDDKSVSRIFCISRNITEETKLNQAKTEFISLASHQLRNPLTSAALGLEMLIKSLKNNDDRSIAEEILADIKFMTEIINKLLNISRIEMGTFSDAPESVELNSFFSEVEGSLVLILKEKKIHFQKNLKDDLPETITVDPNILKNIIQNLLMNAAKNTPEDGKIELLVRMNKSELLISISDTGPGIPPETCPKIFSKMYKAYEMLEEESKSSGLGLYIAKLFTESLGGKIWFETEMGKGTTFYIQLPIKAVKS